jgi:hypothetical protein
MTNTPESAVIGPGSCHTKRTSAPDKFRSTSYGPIMSKAVNPGYVTNAIWVIGVLLF